MHWQLRDALAFENKQELTTLKEKSHHPRSSKHQLHSVLSCLWTGDRKTAGQGEMNSKSFHWHQWVLDSWRFFVCLVSMSCSTWFLECFLRCLSMEKEANKAFHSYCLYITQRDHCCWLSIGVIKVEIKQSHCRYLRSREVYLTALFSWLSSLNSVQWSWKWEKRKLLKVCSLNTAGNHRRCVETMHQLDPTLSSVSHVFLSWWWCLLGHLAPHDVQ